MFVGQDVNGVQNIDRGHGLSQRFSQMCFGFRLVFRFLLIFTVSEGRPDMALGHP